MYGLLDHDVARTTRGPRTRRTSADGRGGAVVPGDLRRDALRGLATRGLVVIGGAHARRGRGGRRGGGPRPTRRSTVSAAARPPQPRAGGVDGAAAPLPPGRDALAVGRAGHRQRLPRDQTGAGRLLREVGRSRELSLHPVGVPRRRARQPRRRRAAASATRRQDGGDGRPRSCGNPGRRGRGPLVAYDRRSGSTLGRQTLAANTAGSDRRRVNRVDRSPRRRCRGPRAWWARR